MKNVVVIGGGTAGWLTALVVNKFWKDTNVTVIESSKIGILGAGEGSTSNFGKMLMLLDIDQRDFFEKTNATVKKGLELTNWTGDNNTIYHIMIGEDKTNKTGFAFHFDAKLTAEYLKSISLSRGITHIDGLVSDIIQIDNNITSVVLDNSNVVDLDFVFDCSGFGRILFEKIYKEKWIDYSKYLLLNKAFGFFLPQSSQYKFEEKTTTDLVSMNCGWMWRVPLQHRWGCGYTFNDNYISVEDAKKEIEEYLGTEIKIQKVFDFKPGRFERSWINNSIAIGLSYSFLEPLEATSLMTVIMQLKRLIDVNFDESNRDGFNKWCEEITEQNMFFVRYHYLCERTDTEFWKDCISMPIPTKLERILSKDGSIQVRNDMELLNKFELTETNINELTFFVGNYQLVFNKNKKTKEKKLL
jgi:tryptophan halogenase